MKKPKVDVKAVKIAKDLLANELQSNKNLPEWYEDGYYNAICDFIDVYTGEDLRAKNLDAFYEQEAKIREVKK